VKVVVATALLAAGNAADAGIVFSDDFDTENGGTPQLN
jgi:hypothetical protein